MDTTTRGSYFLVRYKGFDEDLDDWVPISDLPIRLVDEFYCSPLNMETPHFDLDVDEYDGTNERDCDSDFEDDGDYTPFIPLSQKTIKAQLRALGCYRAPRKSDYPIQLRPTSVIQPSIERLLSKVLDLLPLVESLPSPSICEHSPPICEPLTSNCEPSLFPSHKPPPHPPDPPQSLNESDVVTLYFVCVIQLHLAFFYVGPSCNLGIARGVWSSAVGNGPVQPWLLVEPPDPGTYYEYCSVL